MDVTEKQALDRHEQPIGFGKAALLSFPERAKSFEIDTTFLRFIAIILIINSHLELYYPLPKLAIDGLLGNSMFFMLSGLGLSLSARKKSRGFFAWLYRRAKRIYPALFLVVFIYFILIEKKWNGSIVEYAKLFVWPTPYSFLRQILVYYIAFFFIARLNNQKAYLGAIAFLGILYASAYSAAASRGFLLSDFLHPLHIVSWIFYFQVMLFGGYLGLLNFERLQKKPRDFLILAMLVFGYLATRAAMSIGFIQGYYFLIHVAIFPILFFSVKCLSFENIFVDFPKASVASKTINLIASITLELYIVHVCLLKTGYVKSLFFPFNIAIFVATSVFLAFVVSQICRKLFTINLFKYE
jgi:membrane-bound acyltransferase YfiQ involved in biofilm formation